MPQDQILKQELTALQHGRGARRTISAIGAWAFVTGYPWANRVLNNSSSQGLDPKTAIDR